MFYMRVISEILKGNNFSILALLTGHEFEIWKMHLLFIRHKISKRNGCKV